MIQIMTRMEKKGPEIDQMNKIDCRIPFSKYILDLDRENGIQATIKFKEMIHVNEYTMIRI